MTDTPSSVLLLRLQSTGSNTNTWGGYLNTSLQTLEQASKAYQALAVTGDSTVSWTNYSTGNSFQYAFVKLTGSLSGSATITAPGYPNFLGVWNSTGQAVTVKCSGGTGVTIPNGVRTLIYCDGTDYYSAASSWLSTYQSTLQNNGDLVTNATLTAAISAVTAGSTTNLVLNSVTAPQANYLSALLTTSVGGLLTAQLAKINGATSSEQTQLTIDDRRTLRRAYFVGQV